MAPIRRYLRITKYSVLECRIYLDNPTLADSWLLRSRDPVLPRVIESVRPLVLPKLREERERGKGKGSTSKKRGVKDVVGAEDFEVSIFLTDTGTRHTLLNKQKNFREIERQGIISNSGKLTGATHDTAITVDDIRVRGEESDDEERENSLRFHDSAQLDEEVEEDSLFVAEYAPGGSVKRVSRRISDSASSTEGEDRAKRRKVKQIEGSDDECDDKKKLALDTRYEGFSIYGRVLCLVVKRKNMSDKELLRQSGQRQGAMETWITSTQIPQDE